MIDLTRLAIQGRSFNSMRPWTPEELDALLVLEKERELSRTVAADYVRNGVLNVEDYDAAVKANFKPKTLNEAAEDAEASLKDHKFASAPVDTEKAAKAKAKEEAKAAKAKK